MSAVLRRVRVADRDFARVAIPRLACATDPQNLRVERDERARAKTTVQIPQALLRKMKRKRIQPGWKKNYPRWEFL